MSGHSKWHTIKHKKGAADAKRGKLFSKTAYGKNLLRLADEPQTRDEAPLIL